MSKHNGIHVINDNNTAQLVEMAKLVRKYGLLGNKEVETVNSRENRRRAWVLLKHLATFATHMATRMEQTDFFSLHSNEANKSADEQKRCYDAIRQDDQELLAELYAFEASAAEFKSKSAGKDVKTKAQLAREAYTLGEKEKVAAAKARGVGMDKATKPLAKKTRT